MQTINPRCARCGDWYPACPHTGTHVYDGTDDEAARVRARYALGRRHNPDHDTTSYRDGKTTEDEVPVGNQQPAEGCRSAP